MPDIEYVPLFKPGADITYNATADVEQGRLVEVSGNRQVKAAVAASTKVIGVSTKTVKTGERLRVTSGGVHRLIASGPVAAGDTVQAAAGGLVSTGSTNPVGRALTAAADGAVAQIKLFV